MSQMQNSIDAVRKAICEDAAQLFARSVSLEERAFQALEVVTRKGHTPNAVHVWARLAKSLPAIHLLYEALDISFDSIARPWPVDPVALDCMTNNLGEIDWARTLRAVFCIEDMLTGNTEYTEAGQRVARTGVITVGDLATSIFQSGRVSKRERRRYSNLVFRALARGAGMESTKAKWWSPDLDSFASRVITTFEGIYACDPSLGDQQFILYHDGSSVRLAPFGVFGAFQLQEAPLPDGSLWIARGNLIQPSTRFTTDAILYLEDLINSGAKEGEFQRFFEQHPEFLLACGDYVRLHPQIVLTKDDGQRLIPDFFLEKLNSTFCDVCDLKRPTAELVRHQKNRGRFRDALMEAVAQLTHYRDWFEERDYREAFHRRYGLQAYRPRVIVVIGRRQSFYDEVERIALESQLPSWVTLKTYDDVVERARQWKELLAAP